MAHVEQRRRGLLRRSILLLGAVVALVACANEGARNLPPKPEAERLRDALAAIPEGRQAFWLGQTFRGDDVVWYSGVFERPPGVIRSQFGYEATPEDAIDYAFDLVTYLDPPRPLQPEARDDVSFEVDGQLVALRFADWSDVTPQLLAEIRAALRPFPRP
jgi:hypothetical protein